MGSNTKKFPKIKRQLLLLYVSVQSINWFYLAIIRQSFNLVGEQKYEAFCSDEIIIILIVFLPSYIGKKVHR